MSPSGSSALFISYDLISRFSSSGRGHTASRLNMSGILDVLWWCLLEVSTLTWSLMSWGTGIPQVTPSEINSADSQHVISLCVCLAPELVIKHKNWRCFCKLVAVILSFFFVLHYFCLSSWCNLEILLVSEWLRGEMRGSTGNRTKRRMQQCNNLSEGRRQKRRQESLVSIICWIERALLVFFFVLLFYFW